MLQVAAQVSPDVVRAEVGLRLNTVPLVLAVLYYTAKAQFPSLAAAASEYTQAYSTHLEVIVVIGTLVFFAWAKVQAAKAGAAAAAKKLGAAQQKPPPAWVQALAAALSGTGSSSPEQPPHAEAVLIL